MLLLTYHARAPTSSARLWILVLQSAAFTLAEMVAVAGGSPGVSLTATEMIFKMTSD